MTTETLKELPICSICLERVRTRKNCCLTRCKHAFCLDCLLQACQYSNRCPYCRKALYRVPESILERTETSVAQSVSSMSTQSVASMSTQSFVSRPLERNGYPPHTIRLNDPPSSPFSFFHFSPRR
jgi:hypothetical protein